MPMTTVIEGYHAGCLEPARKWVDRGVAPDDRLFVLAVECDLCGPIDAREFEEELGASYLDTNVEG